MLLLKIITTMQGDWISIIDLAIPRFGSRSSSFWYLVICSRKKILWKHVDANGKNSHRLAELSGYYPIPSSNYAKVLIKIHMVNFYFFWYQPAYKLFRKFTLITFFMKSIQAPALSWLGTKVQDTGDSLRPCIIDQYIL